MKAVIVYSGGLDSTVLLYDLFRSVLQKRLEALYPITFDYGQRHQKEIGAAVRICDWLSLMHIIVDVKNLGKTILCASSQTDLSIEVPEGHYTDETMKQTVVPNRNMIMVSMAIGYAITVGAESVYYAAHAGDHTIYP